ncbi:hypothetical protein GCM10025857_01410 [Alicyclobacillus contaminans]|nr:hypothetical protein GCM10025857_01410 [Alicyclobacillus contaminans]
MKPFLKWAGNKYRIVDKIRALLPDGRRLIEPFAGAAAVFLNTAYESNVLNDINRDVILVYRVLQQMGPAFVDLCKALFTEDNNTPERYYALREEFNDTSDLVRKAALFVYLNRHGYNGLCRYNHSGHFNVPFGRYKKPYFPFQEMMLFYEKAKTAVFRSDDFEVLMAEAQPGDVIYCDPPTYHSRIRPTSPVTARVASTSANNCAWRRPRERRLREAFPCSSPII